MHALESFLDGANQREIRERIAIQRIGDPAAFYEQNASELAIVGADAFGQSAVDFGLQVEERFKKAEFGHAIYDGDQMAGFGLFDTLRGRHWQPAFDRG
jgi:hypothetical protein